MWIKFYMCYYFWPEMHVFGVRVCGRRGGVDNILLLLFFFITMQIRRNKLNEITHFFGLCLFAPLFVCFALYFALHWNSDHRAI